MKKVVFINRGLDGKFTKIEEGLGEFGQAYAELFASQLTLASPSDTGTYLDNFYANNSGTVGTTSSKGKEKKPWDGQKAVDRMVSGIRESYGSNTFVFGNSADHAYEVEYDLGYRPFGIAAEMHKKIVKDAWDMVGR